METIARADLERVELRAGTVAQMMTLHPREDLTGRC
jgi:hypothetical protein